MNIADPIALAYLVLEWTIRVVMLVVVTSRRSPEEARTWLLFVFFLPVPTLVFYLLAGRSKSPRWRRKRFRKARTLLEGAARQIEHSHHCSRPEVSANLAPATRLIEGLSHFPVLGGNVICLLPSYQSTINHLVQDIARAKNHVHLATYIFANDDTGDRVLAALLAAAKRGVECRVLIDAVGSYASASGVISKLRAGGIRAERALPVSILRPHSMRGDIRNHRKIAVIDGRTGYIGSQNIIDEASSTGLINKELVVRIVGPAVLELQAIFAADWFLETGSAIAHIHFFPHEHSEGGSAVQLLASGPEYRLASAGLLIVALVHGAQRKVVLTTPYFVPDDALRLALQAAALRGVDVELVLSRISDSWLVALAQRSYYHELLAAGVVIHLYRDGLLHAKHVSVDDEIVIIGSLNLDMRSFNLNAEASLVCYDPAVAVELRAEQQKNIAASDPLDSNIWNDRRLTAKLAQNIARLFSPLL